MTACVLGVVVWKSLEAKATTLARGQTDIQNLAHSLAEHAAHTIRSADIAMAGMVDLLRYRDPLPERFNPYLADTVNSLPQLREIGVLDVDGKWQYSSLPRNTQAQQFRPKLLHLPSRQRRKRAPHQRAVAIAPDRTVHDHPVEAHRQAGRQLRAASSPPRSTATTSSASTGPSSSVPTAASACCGMTAPS